MEYDDVKKLVEKYWAAETDEAEEEILKNYFAKAETVPDELTAERDLFLFYKAELGIQVPQDDLVDEVKGRLKQKKVYSLPRLLKYAAVVGAISLLASLILQKRESDKAPSFTELSIKEQREIREAQVAMSMLAENLKDGLAPLKELQVLGDPEIDLTKDLNKKN